jgi:dTDP-4-dehydrorhamnose reductase
MHVTPTQVDDISAAMLAAVRGRWPGVFNVASPEALSIVEVVEEIGRVLGRNPVLERKESRSPVVVPDLSRLSAHYDIARFRSFSEGIQTLLADKA